MKKQLWRLCMKNFVDAIISNEDEDLSEIGKKLLSQAKVKHQKIEEKEEDKEAMIFKKLKDAERDGDYLLIPYSTWNWFPEVFKSNVLLSLDYCFSGGVHLVLFDFAKKLDLHFSFLPLGTSIVIVKEKKYHILYHYEDMSYTSLFNLTKHNGNIITHKFYVGEVKSAKQLFVA